MSLIYNKGLIFEKACSKVVHNKTVNTPILVSSALLRQLGLGQVDLAWLFKGRAYIGECKSNQVSVSLKQMKRLKASLSYISICCESNVGEIKLLRPNSSRSESLECFS